MHWFARSRTMPGSWPGQGSPSVQVQPQPPQHAVPRRPRHPEWSQSWAVSVGSKAEKYFEPNSAFVEQLLLWISPGRGFES